MPGSASEIGCHGQSGRKYHSAERFGVRLWLVLALLVLGLNEPVVAAAQTFEEPDFSFVLRTPAGFTGNKSFEGRLTTWKVRNNKSGDALGADELVSVTVNALPRTPGRDPGQEFRAYVEKFASGILHGGAVTEFRPARFAGHEGFDANAHGTLDMGAGPRPVVARILLMEVGDNHVLASAIAFGRGDRNFAEFGDQNSAFALSEVMITTAPSTPIADPRALAPAGSLGANPRRLDWSVAALLGVVVLVGAGLIVRAAVKRSDKDHAQISGFAPAAASLLVGPPPSPAVPQPVHCCTECGARLADHGPCRSCGMQE